MLMQTRQNADEHYKLQNDKYGANDIAWRVIIQAVKRQWHAEWNKNYRLIIIELNTYYRIHSWNIKRVMPEKEKKVQDIQEKNIKCQV